MVPKAITALQTLQMVFGILITLFAFHEKIVAGDDIFADPSVLAMNEYRAGNFWKAGEHWNEAVVPEEGSSRGGALLHLVVQSNPSAETKRNSQRNCDSSLFLKK